MRMMYNLYRRTYETTCAPSIAVTPAKAGAYPSIQLNSICTLDGSPPPDREAFRLPPLRGTSKWSRGDDVVGVVTSQSVGSKAFLAAVLAFALTMTPTAAFASGAGEGVSPFVYELMVFVIAIFVGYFVVWSVTPALHTPLMSVTNAISSVIVVGALLAVGVALTASDSVMAKVFGFLALIMASVNIFGGFLVTNRMLAMYKKKDASPKK